MMSVEETEKMKMKNSFIVLLAVAALAMAFPSFSPAQTGADLFKSKCAVCHGPDVTPQQH
jgi:mono/diheme cytochrome c family protein